MTEHKTVKFKTIHSFTPDVLRKKKIFPFQLKCLTMFTKTKGKGRMSHRRHLKGNKNPFLLIT